MFVIIKKGEIVGTNCV